MCDIEDDGGEYILMLELVDEFCEDAAAAAANYLLFHTNIW